MALVEVLLNDGRVIRASRYSAEETYGDYLELTLSEKTNRLHIQWLLDATRQQFDHWPVVLIEPVMGTDSKGRPCLPNVQCVALFTSTPVWDAAADQSGLVVIWHQEEPSPIPSDEARGRLSRLDWAAHATDYQIN